MFQRMMVVWKGSACGSCSTKIGGKTVNCTYFKFTKMPHAIHENIETLLPSRGKFSCFLQFD